jgi:hypothetical protein
MARLATADHEQFRLATLDAHPILHTRYDDALEHDAGAAGANVDGTGGASGPRPTETVGSIRDRCSRAGR